MVNFEWNGGDELSTRDTIRQSMQQCEAIYSNLQEAMQQVQDGLAKQRLESAITNMEAVINDCRSAIDNV